MAALFVCGGWSAVRGNGSELIERVGLTLQGLTNDLRMVYLTRVEKFNAAHKLWVSQWSEEKNREVFGKCANANWHGHNYALHVTVKGEPDPFTGFIMDAKKLGQLVQEVIIRHVDHSNLNLDVPFIPKDIQPTSENLVILFWRQLAPRLPDHVKLHALKLQETDTIYAEYFGE